MPKYLLQASYTSDGAKGLLSDGGSKRQGVARKLIESVGGKLDAFYYTFGEYDIVAITDLPDNAAAAAVAITLAGSGAITGKTTVLLSPEEIDTAVKRSPTYTPPGR